VLSADLLPNSTLFRFCLRQPGHHISSLISDRLSVVSYQTTAYCLLKQTRGFASPPFDGFAFIGLNIC